MDDDKATGLKIIFTNMYETVEEMFKGQEDDFSNYTIPDRYNVNCSDDIHCESIAMFCNQTVHLCQCAVFHVRNVAARMCELRINNLTNWISSNGTTNSWEVNPYISPYHMPWHTICVMALSGVCIFLLGVYVCLEDKEDADTSGGGVDGRDEDPCKINLEHLDCQIHHL